MGSFLHEHSPTREALPLPHVAGLAYFRSPPEGHSASPIPRPVSPTPRRMSSVPVVKIKSEENQSRHRNSSVPRPISQSISVLEHSSKKPRLGKQPSASSSIDLQKSGPTVQPRSYSRIQSSSLPLGKPTLHPPHTSSRELLPRRDSLLSSKQRPAHHDPSRVRQQLHVRNSSTKPLAGVDAALPWSESGLAPRHLPKSKTSTSLAKSSLSLTPQRQLMKPIEPPLPRSHTMGSLSYLAVDGTKETSSPAKSDSSSANSGSEKELGVVDVLKESRMTDHEVEVYKQVITQTEMNKKRTQPAASIHRKYPTPEAREYTHKISRTTNLILPLTEAFRGPTGASKRFGKINVMKNEEMDRKLLRKNKDHRGGGPRHPVHRIASGGLQVDSTLAGATQQTPTSFTVSDSSLMNGSNPDDEWEVDVKLVKGFLRPPVYFFNDSNIIRQVYFRQEITYWTGRLSTLCDHLKAANAHVVSSNFVTVPASTRFHEVLDAEESFEVAECRRTEYALKELRSYCRTTAALSSFEAFETQFREQLEKRAEALSKLVQGPTIRAADEFIPGVKPKSECKPRFGWHFGQIQTSTIASRPIAPGNNLVSAQRPMIIKSKTTNNLAGILVGEENMTATPGATASSISDAKSLPGPIWQRPTVHEAQVQAKRVREQRIFAKAVVYRRGSGQECGGGAGWMYKTTTRQDSGAGQKVSRGGSGAATNSDESVGGGGAQGWHGNEPLLADDKPAAKGGHSRKSSGADSLSLKKVLSDSMKGMRKIRRSFTGSGSLSGSERLME